MKQNSNRFKMKLWKIQRKSKISPILDIEAGPSSIPMSSLNISTENHQSIRDNTLKSNLEINVLDTQDLENSQITTKHS